MLPAISAEVAGQCQVLVDGGVQTGQDVVRALCLGADGCLMGRPWGYALAAGGQSAVENLLHTIRLEIELTLSLMGKTSISQLGRSELLSLAEVQAMSGLAVEPLRKNGSRTLRSRSGLSSRFFRASPSS